MNQEVTLWVLGILCAVIGTLMLIMLNRLMKQGDETNTLVIEQGKVLVKVATTTDVIHGRVTSLEDWRTTSLQAEVNAAARELIELRLELRGHHQRIGDERRDP